MKKKHRCAKSISHYVLRLFASIFAVVAVVAFVWYLLPTQPKFVCANSISCIKDLSVNVQNNIPGIFDGHTVMPPPIDLLHDLKSPVLGVSTASGEKHIYVDLSTQTLTAYQGDTLFMKTKISSGKWNPTPDGTFKIWVKIRATRMTGGSGDDYYDLPNVPYVMFFSNDEVPEADGFSLHGAYWHDNFGHPMSHGCINMRIVDAQTLYNWASPTTDGTTTYATNSDPGTLVTITGTPPED